MGGSRLSSAALLLSGLAGIVVPEKVAGGLHLSPDDARGVAEIRAGLGGTFAALGGWALATDHPVAQTAVGMTWLGAAAVRLGSLRVDEPETDWTFWAYLSLEVGLGLTALVSGAAARAHRRSASWP